MKAELLNYLKQIGATVDDETGRAELTFNIKDDRQDKVFAYFLSDSMQIIMYDIGMGPLPSLDLKFRAEGRYLKVNCCRRGRCEFQNGEGKSVYISAGEVSMDYYTDISSTSTFFVENYLGIEITMQVDKVIVDLPTLAMLKKAIKRMDMPDYATNINSFYYVSSSENTKRTTDELIKYFAENCDKELIIIKTAELGHNIGTDITQNNIKQRTFANRVQVRIAEDISRKLSDECGERWTVKYFAEKYSISESSVKNYFRNVYGCGFKEYQTMRRMEKAGRLLRETDINITNVAENVGYGSVSKFRAVFVNYFGMTPREYRCSARIDEAQKKEAEANNLL